MTEKELLASSELVYGSGSAVIPDGYERIREPFVDPGTSLRAEFLTNGEGNYIVAFAGTGGIQDIYQDSKLGWEQWEGVRDALLPLISDTLSEDPTARIQFTGHSLGGALAQYAAYDLLATASVDEDLPAPERLAEQLEITTFNGLGGIDGLEAYYAEIGQGAFDPTLAGGLEATHYAVEGDIVSRLGGGHLGGNTRQLADPIGPYDPLTGHALATVEALTAGAEDLGALATAFTPDYLALEGARESIAAFLWSFDLNGDGVVDDHDELAWHRRVAPPRMFVSRFTL